MAKPKTANFGSVSTCTMRAEDLIPSFAWELDNLRNGTNRAHAKLARDARKLEVDGDGYYVDQDDAREVLSDLFTALQEYAPAYAYFGANEGDGADYGFWLDYSFVEEFDGPKVDDPSELENIPADVPEALYVNDHGNITLYARKTARTWRAVWSVV